MDNQIAKQIASSLRELVLELRMIRKAIQNNKLDENVEPILVMDPLERLEEFIG